jgi:prophage regulatory protein
MHIKFMTQGVAKSLTHSVASNRQREIGEFNVVRVGLFTKPVLIGQRSVGWPHDEVKAICVARIAGKSEVEIRELVNHLHTKRTERYTCLSAT